jgi:WD40 repeat protein
MIPRLTHALFLSLFFLPSAQGQVPIAPRTDGLGDPLPPGAIARLGTLRFKHTAGIEDGIYYGGPPTVVRTIFSGDGSKVVSIANTICIWDSATGKVHSGPWESLRFRSSAVAMSPDGAILAAADIDFDITTQASELKFSLWDVSQSKLLRTFKSPPANIHALAFAEGGRTLVSVAYTPDAPWGKVQWRDTETGKVQGSWKLPELQQPVKAAGKKKQVPNTIFLAPDGNSLLVQSTSPKGVGAGGPKAKSPEIETVLISLSAEKHTGRIINRATTKRIASNRVAFSDGGNRVAFFDGLNQVDVRETVTGKLISTVSLPSNAFAYGLTGGLALSKDGSILAICDGNGHIFLGNPSAPKDMRDFFSHGAGDDSFYIAMQGGLSFSPDSKTFSVAVGCDLELYDVATLKEKMAWEGHREGVDHLAFSSDGRRLFSAGGLLDTHPQIVTWNAQTWMQIDSHSSRAPKWPNIGVTSLDQTVYVGKDGDERFNLFNMSSGKMLGRFMVPQSKKDPQYYGFFSPGSKFYVLPGKDERGNGIYRLYGVPSCKLLCELPASAMFPADGGVGMQNWLAAMTRSVFSFSSDGRLVAFFSRNMGVIDVVETATGKLRHRLGNKLENQDFGFFDGATLAFSPDGKLLVSWFFFEENLLHVWDMETAKEKRRLMLEPAGHGGLQLAWSQDGRMLAVGSGNTIKVWEVATIKVRCELKGHQGDVRSLAFSPNGRLLASGSVDTTVLVWDLWDR